MALILVYRGGRQTGIGTEAHAYALVEPVGEERVEVSHQDDRYLEACRTRLSHRLHRFLQVHPFSQGPHIRSLDGRTISLQWHIQHTVSRWSAGGRCTRSSRCRTLALKECRTGLASAAHTCHRGMWRGSVWQRCSMCVPPAHVVVTVVWCGQGPEQSETACTPFPQGDAWREGSHNTATHAPAGRKRARQPPQYRHHLPAARAGLALWRCEKDSLGGCTAKGTRHTHTHTRHRYSTAQACESQDASSNPRTICERTGCCTAPARPAHCRMALRQS